MQIKTGTLGGTSVIIGYPGATLEGTVTFTKNVSKVAAVLNGFDVSFQDGDNNFKQLKIRLRATLRANKKTVDVKGDVRLRDKESGASFPSVASDAVKATVYYTVIAEESRIPRPVTPVRPTR